MLQRTTVTAERDDLETLKTKARREGVSLSELMRELIAREAKSSRKHERPRSIGIAKAGRNLSQESIDKEKDLTFLLEE